MDRAQLKGQLAAYSPLDEREQGYRKRMLELCEAGDPFGRKSFVPGHFTASAIVLAPQRDAVLLIFHKKLELWLQPGGHVDPSDPSILHAAEREVMEEVGISGSDLGDRGILDLDIHPIPGFGSEPAHEHFDVRFLFQARSREFEKTDEVAAARWVKVADLHEVTPDASVRRAVAKLQSRA
jgi:8-oxo-dGTP pyrophosphatase MutT (NUDIX family)